MNTFTLKMTALILMVLDHIGCYFDGAPVWLNWLGRLSYPLFLFCMVQGYRHTRSRKRYLLRLYLMSLFMTGFSYFLDSRFPTPNGYGNHNIFLPMLLTGVLISTIECFGREDSFPVRARDADSSRHKCRSLSVARRMPARASTAGVLRAYRAKRPPEGILPSRRPFRGSASLLCFALFQTFERRSGNGRHSQPGCERIRLRVHRAGRTHVLPVGEKRAFYRRLSDLLRLAVLCGRRFRRSVADGGGASADASLQRSEGARAQIFFLFLLPGPYVPSVLACKFRVLIFPADCLSAPKCRSAKSFLTDRQSRAIISP